MAEVYRICLREGTRDSSSGRTEYYTDRDDFESDLMDFALEVEIRGSDAGGHPVWNRRKRLRRWLITRRPETKHKDYNDSLRDYGVRSIRAAEQFIDSEWVALEWDLVEPSITVWRPE